MRSSIDRLSSVRPHRAVRFAIAAAICTLGLGAAHTASAYTLKHAPSGANVHWASKTVTFELTPSLAKQPGASDAVGRALAGWGAIAGAPTLVVESTKDDIVPQDDGRNIVYFAKHGSAQTGGALAVSILSFDATTGELVDADIVINGEYDFAVLPDDTVATPGAPMVGTDGDGEATWRAGTFDLIEVLSHEVGHCLGLAHDVSDTAAIMFPMISPDDVDRRDPSPDDVAGVVSDYASVTLGTADTVSQGGCSASPAPTASSATWVAAAAMASVAAATRRRRLLQRA